jgi:NhaC family Na+:H+ antiporter
MPSLGWSLVPITALLLTIVGVIIVKDADAAQAIGPYILLGAALLTVAIAIAVYRCPLTRLWMGLRKSASQILPAIPILVFIATVSATWMMSGVVPALIDYGLQLLSPQLFLFLACAICSAISVISGSSWTTIATIGVALMGIGQVLGFSDGWIAGAIISGAYFGDKMSPLSDTTVLASSSCGVDLFAHIRYMFVTTIPSMTIALIVYFIVGQLTPTAVLSHSIEITEHLHASFNITPWVLLIPLITCVLILLRLKTVFTLALSTLLGLAGMFVFQPQVVTALGGDSSLSSNISVAMGVLFTETSIDTGSDMLNSLVSTGGVEGMLSTIYLVLCSMIFGGMMIGSGMIATITRSFTRRLHSIGSIVGATVGSGLFFNACTADQYLSLILGGNVYKNIYKRNGLNPRLLSRSLEDSISVTSVLIPWNSCGVTQSTVLGVATIVYLPYCLFNWLSPLMTLLVAWLCNRYFRKAVFVKVFRHEYFF